MPGPGFNLPPSAKSQFFLGPAQGFADDTTRQNALDALYSFGEYSIFVLLWTAYDYRNGDVGLCRRCTGDESRAFRAYRQPTTQKCPDCYGSTFEGGYRAKVVRPCIWSDTNVETTQGNRGVLRTDTVSVETTADISIHAGDIIIRHDNTRYLTNEPDPIILRDSFSHPNDQRSQSNILQTVHRDDPNTGASYLVDPVGQAATEALLNIPPGTHRPLDFSGFDVSRGTYL
jgi:hypothetical protein